VSQDGPDTDPADNGDPTVILRRGRIGSSEMLAAIESASLSAATGDPEEI
jgi:hypothetical protein